jgi:putative ABC transport system ATP-binding protein
MKKVSHLIEADLVGKDYQIGDSVVAAVREVDFYIDDGEFVSIMGPSGAGKSTLLSILGGLCAPTSGKLFVDSMDIYQLPSENRADYRSEYIGFIFQSFQLIQYLTVMENILLPMCITGIKKSIQEKKAQKVLSRVGLTNKANRLPDQLSGGEQERVAIARAIVNNPPILLADEPTGNLDSKTSNDIMTTLKELNDNGQTIVMVTHNHENEKFVSRSIRLSDGMVDS